MAQMPLVDNREGNVLRLPGLGSRKYSSLDRDTI